jgi:hypothetical protein
MNIHFIERWHVTKRWQRKEAADEFESHAAECREIAQRHGDLVKEQYEALARQWLIIAEQRARAA